MSDYELTNQPDNKENKMKKELVITMPDGSRWSVPVDVIARNRAESYADEFDGDVERSLAEDTVPLFAIEHEVKDWAAGNMNWEDVAPHARMVSPGECDYQEGWVNGEKELA